MSSEDTFIEPLLRPTPNRFVLFPIKYDTIYELYKQSINSFWKPDEVDLGKDLTHWSQLTKDEQFYIKHVLAFFAASDGIVNENLAVRFMQEVQIAEARNFYASQIAIEAVHSEMYSLMIQTYVQDEQERHQLFSALETIPAIAKKGKWALKWIDSNESFAERLLAFACVEGIFFSSSFAAIYWLKKRGLMPGLCTSNEFISRDEGLHCRHAAELFKLIERKPTTERIQSLFREAAELEKEFVREALPVRLIGMNNELMCNYVDYITDFWLQWIDQPPIYNAKLDLEYMELISLPRKSNFFEHKPTEYKRGTAATENDFKVDENFEF